MSKSEFTQTNFNKLLNWLDEDKEIAARKYQSIHQRLVQIFLARKVFPAEELADRTIDVAMQKIDFLATEFKGEPAVYFYSIAQNIILEEARKPKKEELTDRLLQEDPRISNENKYLICLRECMQTLLPEQRRLIIKYFKYTKETKIDHHKEMSEKLGLDVNTLRTRVYRIKKTLEKCTGKCFKKNNV